MHALGTLTVLFAGVAFVVAGPIATTGAEMIPEGAKVTTDVSSETLSPEQTDAPDASMDSSIHPPFPIYTYHHQKGPDVPVAARDTAATDAPEMTNSYAALRARAVAATSVKPFEYPFYPPVAAWDAAATDAPEPTASSKVPEIAAEASDMWEWIKTAEFSDKASGDAATSTLTTGSDAGLRARAIAASTVKTNDFPIYPPFGARDATSTLVPEVSSSPTQTATTGLPIAAVSVLKIMMENSGFTTLVASETAVTEDPTGTHHGGCIDANGNWHKHLIHCVEKPSATHPRACIDGNGFWHHDPKHCVEQPVATHHDGCIDKNGFWHQHLEHCQDKEFHPTTFIAKRADAVSTAWDALTPSTPETTSAAGFPTEVVVAVMSKMVEDLWNTTRPWDAVTTPAPTGSAAVSAAVDEKASSMNAKMAEVWSKVVDEIHAETTTSSSGPSTTQTLSPAASHLAHIAWEWLEQCEVSGDCPSIVRDSRYYRHHYWRQHKHHEDDTHHDKRDDAFPVDPPSGIVDMIRYKRCIESGMNKGWTATEAQDLCSIIDLWDTETIPPLAKRDEASSAGTFSLPPEEWIKECTQAKIEDDVDAAVAKSRCTLITRLELPPYVPLPVSDSELAKDSSLSARSIIPPDSDCLRAAINRDGDNTDESDAELFECLAEMMDDSVRW